MTSSSADVLVIGGGVAGVAAALEAAAAGARVALVRAGPGATALCSGAWSGALSRLLADALAAAGLPFVPATAPLPHPSGDLRPCDFAGASHAAAQVRVDSWVCGVEGLPGYPARALARAWGAARHHVLRLPGTPASGWSPVSLAALLDREPGLLAAALAGLEAPHVVLPAVIGLEDHRAAWSELRRSVPFEVGEALGGTPSIPGWRLDRALLAALAAAGVEVLHARVVGRSGDAGRLESVTLEGDVASPTFRADRFVLATGRFVGGGITADSVTDAVDVAHGRALREASLVERALGCDVWVEHLGERFTQVQPVPLTSAARAEPQPLLAAGVRVDEESRPVDESGRVRYANVVARGAVIAERPHGLGFAAGGST